MKIQEQAKEQPHSKLNRFSEQKHLKMHTMLQAIYKIASSRSLNCVKLCQIVSNHSQNFPKSFYAKLSKYLSIINILCQIILKIFSNHSQTIPNHFPNTYQYTPERTKNTKEQDYKKPKALKTHKPSIHLSHIPHRSFVQ